MSVKGTRGYSKPTSETTAKRLANRVRELERWISDMTNREAAAVGLFQRWVPTSTPPNRAELDTWKWGIGWLEHQVPRRTRSFNAYLRNQLGLSEAAEAAFESRRVHYENSTVGVDVTPIDYLRTRRTGS
jgi:hypothetical protein